MAYPLKSNQTNIISEPGSYTYTIGTTGLHFASMQGSNGVAGSDLVLTIAQSGSASVTITSPSELSAQTHVELQGLFKCVAGDVMTFTVADTQPINSVKVIAKINLGLC